MSKTLLAPPLALAFLAGGAHGAFNPPDQPVRIGNRLVYPEGNTVPRNLTPVERDFIRDFPLAPPPPSPTRATYPVPTGPVHCAAEYEPMAGVFLAWEQFTTSLRDMALNITTIGDADVWIAVDNAAEQTSATTTLSNAGVPMNRVHFVVRATDTVWIRDYGPRYIYEGDCRAIVDHTYNRPRPLDDAYSSYFAQITNTPIYAIPLVHGGGNYHLDANDNSFCTRLINNENPSLTESQIHGFWADYQNVDTTFFTPFRTSVDSTQHLDMWMQVVSDTRVVIADWPQNPGNYEDAICDQAALDMAARGYTVSRVPAEEVSNVHYTYTNVVICNDLLIVPTYTNSTIVARGYNTQAVNTWTAVWDTDGPGGKQVVQLNGQPIVTSAGVFHCVMMHLPAPKLGAIPAAYLRNYRTTQTLTPGAQIDLNWITDDDKGVVNVDLLASTDGGVTYPHVLAAATANDGSFVWTVPDWSTQRLRFRVVPRDADGNIGRDSSEENLAIAGSCPADVNFDGTLDAFDYDDYVSAYFDFVNNGAGFPDYNTDGYADAFDYDDFVSDFFTGCD